MLDGFEDKTAYAVATFAYSEGPGHEPILFEGRTEVCHVLAVIPLCYVQDTDLILQGKLVPSRGPTVFGESKGPS